MNTHPGMPVRTAPPTARSLPIQRTTPSAADGRLPPLPRHALRRIDSRSCSAAEHPGPVAHGSRALANQPAIPCGLPSDSPRRPARVQAVRTHLRRPAQAVPVSLAFYDRREPMHFAATELAIPQLYDGARPLTMSQDPRQTLCYQCHAPRMPEAGSAAAATPGECRRVRATTARRWACTRA